MIFIFSLFIFSMNTWAETPKSFVYHVQLVGADQSCQKEGQRLSQKFEQATQIKVDRFECQAESHLDNVRVDQLALFYSAPQPETPYRAKIGPYWDLASCRSDVKKQVTFFEDLTSLTAVVGTCEQQVSYGTELQYFVRIEGFSSGLKNQPEQTLQSLESLQLPDFDSQLRPQIENLLKQNGATLVLKQDSRLVYYRSEKLLPFWIETRWGFEKDRQCESQIPSLEAALAQSGVLASLSWCFPMSGGYSLHSLTVSNSPLSEYHPVEFVQYPRFESCLDNQTAVLEDSRNSSALGALCYPYSSGGFQMKLLRKSWD